MINSLCLVSACVWSGLTLARTAVLRQPTLSAKWSRVLVRPGLLSSAVLGSVWKPIGTPGGVELNGPVVSRAGNSTRR